MAKETPKETLKSFFVVILNGILDVRTVNGGVVSAAVIESHPALCVAVVPDKGRSFFTMEVGVDSFNFITFSHTSGSRCWYRHATQQGHIRDV